MAKRLFDIGVSLVILLVLALPLVAVALTVRVRDGKPVFFRQRRIGRGGKPFWLYKFRSMETSKKGPVVTTKRDPRITPLGALLRRWKIDELPQFWNVLRGDMSLVGPRPEAERLISHYTSEQRKLLAVKPGLAGMAQLVYPHEAELLRGYADPEEVYLRELMPKKITVDLEYERTRTFLSDMRLLGELALLIALGKSSRIDPNVSIATEADELHS
jgi:lipopolysaccharide/colanic/teichoic acid biosynthesis glycosyltransferase